MRYAKHIIIISILLIFAVTGLSGGSGQYSHPTTMSLQGTVEGISDGNLGVKVSEQSDCSAGVFFDHNYSDAIQDSLFNQLLGSQFDLNLNYNQDYYMCLYVNGELIDGPQQFRGGQGQIDVEDVNSAGFATEFVPYSGAVEDVELGAYNLKTTGSVCFDQQCNAKMYYDTETGDLVIDVE